LATVTATAWSLAAGSSEARAANWAEKLFHEPAHDFGPVPRGVKVRHPFVLTNSLAEPVTIVNVRASCGCTTGQATASLVQPGQSATVDAEMDTRNFVGKKATVLYVTLITASGKEGEARLGVSSTILSDIVLNPGSVDFGGVARGQTPSPSQVLTVDRVGVPNWRVERMVSACRAIDATLVETTRNGPNVGYRLTVSLKPDAPAGVVRDEIRLVTNDPETPVFPVQVSATIRGELTATPAVLILGHVSPAGGAQGRFLVRASKPFTVRTVEGAGDGFTVSADDTTPKPVHLVTVSYKPEEGKTRGDLRKVFRVHTDLPGEPPLDLAATLHVDP
jgi:hypothetical protein